jgi:hypothetical protein
MWIDRVIGGLFAELWHLERYVGVLLGSAERTDTEPERQGDADFGI